MAAKKLKIRLTRNTFVKGEMLEVQKTASKNIHTLDREDALALIAAKKAEFYEGSSAKTSTKAKAGEPIDRQVKTEEPSQT